MHHNQTTDCMVQASSPKHMSGEWKSRKGCGGVRVTGRQVGTLVLCSWKKRLWRLHRATEIFSTLNQICCSDFDFSFTVNIRSHNISGSKGSKSSSGKARDLELCFSSHDIFFYFLEGPLSCILCSICLPKSPNFKVSHSSVIQVISTATTPSLANGKVLKYQKATMKKGEKYKCSGICDTLK